jgi:digeranylgeranylglycerophospholipid reductase
MYDIVIVGAGPAGSMAGITAAKRGCKVLLIEEHKEIGVPLACGEGISRKRLAEFVNIKSNWIATPIEGAKFYSPSGRSFRVRYPNVGYVLERKIFDRDLALLAAESGCEIKVGVKAIGLTQDGLKTNKGEIRTKIIIGADGIESRVAKWAGIDTRIGREDFWVAYEYLLGGVDVNVGEIEFMFGEKFAPGGYGWVFPKGNGLANVGVGVFPMLTRKSPKFFLEKIIAQRFKKYNIMGIYNSIVPAKLIKSLVNHNVCVIGDAARLVDPISGGGIGNALLSGKLAGEASAIAIKTNDMSKLKLYEKEWEKQEGKNFRFRFKVRDVFMKLKDKELELLFDFGKQNFGDKTITEINEFEIIKNIIKFSPKLLKLGIHLLKPQ